MCISNPQPSQNIPTMQFLLSASSLASVAHALAANSEIKTENAKNIWGRGSKRLRLGSNSGDSDSNKSKSSGGGSSKARPRAALKTAQGENDWTRAHGPHEVFEGAPPTRGCILNRSVHRRSIHASRKACFSCDGSAEIVPTGAAPAAALESSSGVALLGVGTQPVR